MLPDHPDIPISESNMQRKDKSYATSFSQKINIVTYSRYNANLLVEKLT